MEYTNGTYKILEIKNADNWLPIGCLTSNSFQEQTDTIQSNASGSKDGWVSSRSTNQSYSISFSGLVTSEPFLDTNVTYYNLISYKRNKILVDWRIIDENDKVEYGKGYINELGNTASVDEFISFDGNIVGFGNLTDNELGRLLLEDGNYLLLETNEKIIL